MNKLKVWIKASRLASQSYIFFPLLLGQGMAYYFNGKFNWTLFFLIQLFGIFNQFYIVYANDYADYEVDKINDTYNAFSGGSRVLVEGDLSKKELKFAIKLMIFLNFLVGTIITLAFSRVYVNLIIILALLLLWAYSYEPIKLSYRGGGELLQCIGVAFILPIFAYYVQSGEIKTLFPLFFITYLPMQLACALSTTLPDYPSDKIGNKNTLSVLIGYEKVKKIIICLNLLSLLLFTVLNPFMLKYRNIFYINILPLISNFIMLSILKKSLIKSKYLDLFIAINIFSLLIFTIILTCNLFV